MNPDPRTASFAGLEPKEVRADHVLGAAGDGEAAGEGEALALEIADKLSDRSARICVVLAGLPDPDRVVLSGAVAPALAEVIGSAEVETS